MEHREIIVTPIFEKALKRLSKKYRSVKGLLQGAIATLETTPNVGDEIKGHQDFFKIRYPNPDAKKGKSGGFRLIYYWSKASPALLVLVDIYSKSDQEEVDWNSVKHAMEGL